MIFARHSSIMYLDFSEALKGILPTETGCVFFVIPADRDDVNCSD